MEREGKKTTIDNAKRLIAPTQRFNPKLKTSLESRILKNPIELVVAAGMRDNQNVHNIPPKKEIEFMLKKRR